MLVVVALVKEDASLPAAPSRARVPTHLLGTSRGRTIERPCQHARVYVCLLPVRCACMLPALGRVYTARLQLFEQGSCHRGRANLMGMPFAAPACGTKGGTARTICARASSQEVAGLGG